MPRSSIDDLARSRERGRFNSATYYTEADAWPRALGISRAARQAANGTLSRNGEKLADRTQGERQVGITRKRRGGEFFSFGNDCGNCCPRAIRDKLNFNGFSYLFLVLCGLKEEEGDEWLLRSNTKNTDVRSRCRPCFVWRNNFYGSWIYRRFNWTWYISNQ